MSKKRTTTRGGTAPSGSFTLPDPTLINDLRSLALELGYTQGERGSVSGLIAALAAAARADSDATTRRLKFLGRTTRS